MRARQFWQRMLFIFFGLFLAVAGMAINAEAASALGSSLTQNATGETGVQIAAKAKQALFITFPFFGEQSYSETRSILENKGVKVVVASSSVDPMSGYDKKLTVKPDMLLSQVHTAEFDAIVFIGAGRYESDNVDAIRIAEEGAAEGKILAAIGMGTFTLIKAGLLNGKKIAMKDDFWVQKAGATRSDAPVERDGIIITGAGPSASQQFAETVAAALTAGSE